MTAPLNSNFCPSSVSNVALENGKRAGLGLPAVNSTKSNMELKVNSQSKLLLKISWQSFLMRDVDSRGWKLWAYLGEMDDLTLWWLRAGVELQSLWWTLSNSSCSCRCPLHQKSMQMILHLQEREFWSYQHHLSKRVFVVFGPKLVKGIFRILGTFPL